MQIMCINFFWKHLKRQIYNLLSVEKFAKSVKVTQIKFQFFENSKKWKTKEISGYD